MQVRRFLLSRFVALAATGLCSFAGLNAHAQSYPTKPLRIVVPFGAGGVADLTARTVAQKMSEGLGQSVVIDNRPGAGGIVAAEMVAKSEPDGYTLLLMSNANAVSAGLFKSLPFDPIKDFTPVSLMGTFDLAIVTAADSRFQSLPELLSWAKANPGKLSYASGGIGGSHHLSGALFEHSAGIDMIHAPYKSGSAAATDLMGGQVHMMFEQMYAAMPSIQGGRMRALAITSKNRSPLLPDLPTMAEQGYGEVEVQNWQGLVGPKGMPADLVKLLKI